MLRLKVVFLTVVFLLVANLFVTRSASTNSNVVRLTKTPEQTVNLNPSLSDDGHVVVFESSANFFSGATSDSFHAIRADLRGDPPVFVALAGTRVISPALSSDGSVMAFASTEDLTGENPDRNSEIFLLNGSGLKQITHTEPDSSETRLVDGNLSPSISSDGGLMAFTSRGDLRLFDVRTGDLSELTQGVSPKLSGDGSRVYYQKEDDLFSLDLKTRIERIVASNVPKLTVTNGRAVSNDGTRLVYAAEFTANQSQVFVYDARAGTVRQLTQLGSRVTDVPLAPTISGDGKRVAFATRRRVTNTSDGSVELYVYDIPSGQIQQVTNAPTSATGEVVASLNFDGSVVAFSFPRALSETVADEFNNNNEIYVASLLQRAEFGTATVVNAASESSRLARGSIARIRGSALAFTPESASSVNLPFALAGTTITIKGQAAPLIYASPTEVLFVLPESLPDGAAEFVVTNSDGFSEKATATIAGAAPGLFTETDEAIALDSDTHTVGPFDPTNGRLRLSLFATGVLHATNVSAAINGQPVKVETIATTELRGLDEIHLLVTAELRGAGRSTLIVTGDGNESNAVTLTLSGSPLRDVVINEFLADPPDGLAGDANHDGVRDASADEFIELVNSTAHDIDLGGFQLQSRSLTATADTLRHRFATGTRLPAGTAIVVFGGGAPNVSNPLFAGAQVVKASTGGLSLVNGGGVVTLRNRNGEIVTSVAYGTSLGLRADQNQSLTRAPDVFGNFSLHSSVAERSFSPGTRIDGSPFVRILANASIASPANISHALSLGGNHFFSSRAFWFRQLPRRPT